MATAAYLVLFVADPATDDHADAVRDVARAVGGAGFFDDPDGGDERTVGAYLRAEDPAAGDALVRAVIAVSARLGARFEVQWREEVVGYIAAGEPDEGVVATLRMRDIPEGL